MKAAGALPRADGTGVLADGAGFNSPGTKGILWMRGLDNATHRHSDIHRSMSQSKAAKSTRLLIIAAIFHRHNLKARLAGWTMSTLFPSGRAAQQINLF